MRLSLVGLLCVALAPLPSAQESGGRRSRVERGFLSRQIADADGVHRFVIYVPPDYEPDHPAPGIVFLHGAGECGTDGFKQVSVGLGTAIMDDVAAWPFLVLFPQKPTAATQWEDHDAMVMAMLDAMRAEFAVDSSRLFLTGLSQGGHGTFVLGARHHELWTAVAPLCGYGDPAAVKDGLKGLPVWCFHGEVDKAVPVEQSKRMVAVLREAGGDPHLSLYPELGHNCWDRVYRGEPLAVWFLAARERPALAAVLADPTQVLTAEVTLREAAADGTVSLRVLTLDRDSSRWRAERIGPDGAVAVTASGDAGREAGRSLFADALRDLARAGLFEPVPPASQELLLRIAITAQPGSKPLEFTVSRDDTAPRLRAAIDRTARRLAALR
ncbi:MAG: alpha/beta hydrolase-fold protein [Planctomycetota bacterium]